MNQQQRAVARQALEAMEYHTVQTRPLTRTQEAMDALRQLLEQPAPVQEPVAYSVGRTLHWHEGRGVNDAQLYTTPPAQPEPVQEPVGYLYGNSYWEATNPRITDDVKRFGSPRYTTPPAQPATWVGLMRGVRVDGDRVIISTKNNDAARQLCMALLEKNGGKA